MKKKIGSIILAGLMACTMAAGVAFTSGCRKARVQPEFVMPEGGFDTETPIEINFYHTMGANLRAVLERYIVKFQKLYPNITVVNETIGSYDDVRDQIQTEIIGGRQPNLAYCYPDHVALFNQAGAVQSLNDFLPDGYYNDVTITRKDGTEVSLNLTTDEKNDFIKGYYDEGFKFDDGSKMYTLPFLKSTEVLYYNKTVFNELGLSEPKTWDDLEHICEVLKENYPNCVPFGYDSEANWFITMCEQLGTPYTSSSGEHFLFDTPENRAFVEKFKTWKSKGYFTTQSLLEGKYTSTLFVKAKDGGSFMSIGSSAGATNQRPASEEGKYPFEVGITSIPQVNPEKPKVISQGPSVCIFKKSNPQEVLASWLFIKYLTTNPDFQAEFSDASGYVPVLNSVLENDIYKDYMQKAETNGTRYIQYYSATVCMQQEKAYYTSPAFVGSSKARDMVGSLMASVFAGTDIDTAFKEAIRQCRNATE